MSFLRYSMLKNIATLKSQPGVNQGHWKWYHSIHWILCLLEFYSNFFSEMHCFWDIRLQKFHDLENGVSGPLRSLKVSPFDRVCMTSYFHSNHGPILYHFRDKWRFQSKITKFSHPLVFCAPPPLKGFLVELGIGARGQKTRMMGLPDRLRSLTISSAVLTECTNVTDRRTMGHSKDHAYT